MIGPFSAWRLWREQRAILREVRKDIAHAKERNRFKVKDDLMDADSALAVDDRRRATTIVNKLITDFPNEFHQSRHAFSILLRLGRLDEAKAMILAGQRKNPRDPFFLQALGQIAQTKQDHEEAINVYAILRKRFPAVMEGYVAASASLRALHRLDEAEAICQQAATLRPDDMSCRVEQARIADVREDWLTALQRWEVVATEFGVAVGAMGSGRALQQLGRLEEAEQRLIAGRVRFPTAYEIYVQLADVARQRGDEATEQRYLNTLLERFPLVPHVYYEVSYRLTSQGKYGDADAVLARAVERFPQELRPAFEYAVFAENRQDWQEAAKRWAAVRAAWPDCEDGYVRGARVLDLLNHHDEAAQVRAEHARQLSE